MSIPTHLAEFWRGFADLHPNAAREERFYEAFYFGDSELLANKLAALVLAGKKRATAAAAWCYEAEGQRLPASGDLSIMTDWAGTPLCVIETQAVEVMPFDQVDPEFAAAEGEGDCSLEFWRDAHRDFFSREAKAAGREFSESMLIVCERFKILYVSPASVA